MNTFRKLLALTAYKLLATMGVDRLSGIILKTVELFSAFAPTATSMKFLLKISQGVETLLGQQAQRYGDGFHPKIRMMRYPEFFAQHVRDGERVVDLGMGTGLVAHAIAVMHPQSDVVGVDMMMHYVKAATNRYSLPNLSFAQTDILKWKPKDNFDVVVMSNILEHFDDRVGLLQKLVKLTSAHTFLIRVPCYDRHWTVPLMDELEMDYFLDPTHFVEYTNELFESEVKRAGLTINHIQRQYGEIWAVLKVKS